ncbi:MAG: hypothetical protein ABIR33_07295 [Pyrinomonadaceae bacterium]
MRIICGQTVSVRLFMHHNTLGTIANLLICWCCRPFSGADYDGLWPTMVSAFAWLNADISKDG